MQEKINTSPQNDAVETRRSAAGEILTTLIFYLAILLFIIGFNFSDRMAGNWYQQFLPSIGNRSITDIFFLDSLTGWAITNATNQGNDTIFVLKTTNSGDGWVIQHTKIQTGGGFSGYFRVYFLNQNTGYTCDVRGIYKTTDGGSNWLSLNAPLTAYTDMSVLDTDTIWIVTPDSFSGGVYRTTNGGGVWDRQLDLGSQNPSRIYFFNRDLGFASESTGQTLYRTSNSGLNWTTHSTAGAFTDMFFANSLTGWKSGASGGPGFRKTTDGGLNWNDQVLPSGGNITYSQIEKISGLNKDTLWGVRAFLLTSSGFRGMINRTTNGGVSWMFQVPDTAYQIGQYDHIDFPNRLNGWAYLSINKGIHTTTGGDPIWLTPVSQISTEVPKEFELYQNYPNPFNPATNIKYQISNNKSNVKIKVFDITGKEIIKLVDQKQSAGTYLVEWNASGYSSGVYFYSLLIENKVIDTKRMLLLK